MKTFFSLLLCLSTGFASAQSFPRIGYAGLLITNVVGASQIGAGGGGGSLAFGSELGRLAEFESAGTTVLTTSAACASGNEIVVIVSGRAESQTLTSVTDTRGNTYAINAGCTNGTGVSAFTMWIATTKATTTLQSGDSITITWGNPSASRRTVFAASVTGPGSSPVDVSAQNATYASAVSVAATTTASSVIVGGVMATSGSAYSPNWTQIGATQTRTDGAVLTYVRTAASSGSQTMSGSLTPNDNYCGVWVAIK